MSHDPWGNGCRAVSYRAVSGSISCTCAALYCPRAVCGLIQEIKRRTKRLDILVNMAGVAYPGAYAQVGASVGRCKVRGVPWKVHLCSYEKYPQMYPARIHSCHRLSSPYPVPQACMLISWLSWAPPSSSSSFSSCRQRMGSSRRSQSTTTPTPCSLSGQWPGRACRAQLAHGSRPAVLCRLPEGQERLMFTSCCH